MSLRSFVIALRRRPRGESGTESEYLRNLEEMQDETSSEVASQFEEEEYGTPGKAPTEIGYSPSEAKSRQQEQSLVQQFFFDPEQEDEDESVGEAKDWKKKEEEEKEDVEDMFAEETSGKKVQVGSAVVYNSKGILRASALQRITNKLY